MSVACLIPLHFQYYFCYLYASSLFIIFIYCLLEMESIIYL